MSLSSSRLCIPWQQGPNPLFRCSVLSVWHNDWFAGKKKKAIMRSSPSGAVGLMIQLVFVEAQVQSPHQHHASRIWRCCSCGIGHSTSRDWIPGPCCRGGQKRKNKRKQPGTNDCVHNPCPAPSSTVCPFNPPKRNVRRRLNSHVTSKELGSEKLQDSFKVS